MSITKLKTAGPWGPAGSDLPQAGSRLTGRIITGMLTGADGLLARSAPTATDPAGEDPGPGSRR